MKDVKGVLNTVLYERKDGTVPINGYISKQTDHFLCEFAEKYDLEDDIAIETLLRIALENNSI